jgi:hypothetical protein
MKKLLTTAILFLFFIALSEAVSAQCSICTKTAQQLGEGPAKALNGAIIYLAAAPLAMMGFIGYRWYRNNRES